MEYGDVIWDNCTEGEASLLESIQYECARVVTGAIKGTSARALINKLAWESLGRAPGGKCTSYFICLKFLGVYHLHILLNYFQILWTKERVVHYDLGEI